MIHRVMDQVKLNLLMGTLMVFNDFTDAIKDVLIAGRFQRQVA